MKRIATGVLAVMILAAGVLGVPATKPVVPARSPQPASKPATKPAETLADPAFVTDFNEKLSDDVRGGKAKFDDVIGKLREMGALGSEPKRFGGKDPIRWYRLELGYPWEYAGYMFFVDGEGVIYKFEFTPAQWPLSPGDASYARNPEYKLKEGNKWWLVKSRTYTSADRSNVTLNVIQARTADEAAQALIAKRKQNAIKTAKMMKTPAQDWLARMDEVEVHEWFTPRLTGRKAERIN